jgi:hypothetical protein
VPPVAWVLHFINRMIYPPAINGQNLGEYIFKRGEKGMSYKDSRLSVLIIVLVPCLLMAANVVTPAGDTLLVKQVAQSCGIDSFGSVSCLRFTFNVAFDGKEVSRAWTWDIKNDRVTSGKAASKDTFSYERKQVRMGVDDRLKKTDAKFINDQYWLLFPMHLIWDSVASLHVAEKERLPLGGGLSTRITVVYPPAGGYTPGDAYDLYIGPFDRIVQWVYRHGNADQPTRIASWKDYTQVGPLTLSLDRPGGDGHFRVWFTDVAVMKKGAGTWIPAKRP